MRIVLLGFMGAGKSTLADELSRRIGWPVIELDAIVLERSRRTTIHEIFARDGEAWFRQLEHESIAALPLEQYAILSTGGGVIENDDNMTLLQQKDSTVVYLHVSFSEICKRLSHDTTRPLFTDPEKAKRLYKKRLPIYREWSDIEFTTDGQPISLLAEKIINHLQLPTSRSIHGDEI